MESRIISLWSGPRNVSTALMYSFAQRPDTQVVDEPLYAYYLRKSGAIHPGRQEVLDSMPSDPRAIWNDLKTSSRPILFIKNMAHHAEGINTEWLDIPGPVLLVRDPLEMLPSLQKQIPLPILRDTGLGAQVELLDYFLLNGKDPVVLDSKRLLKNPEGMLTALCRHLKVAFDEQMLSWNPGPRPEDGVWAKYWYQRVHKSTGFEPYHKKEEMFPSELEPLLDECRPLYYKLLDYAIDE